jgi:hypothetical protein
MRTRQNNFWWQDNELLENNANNVGAQTEISKSGSGPSALGRPNKTLRGWMINPQALPWIGAAAFFGIFYFVGIGIGYLAFAGLLSEVRLRYMIAGDFAIIAALRAYALFRHDLKPTRQGAMMYGLFALITIVQGLWYVPISNAGGVDIYLTTIGETVISSGILAITGESLGILWVAGRKFGAQWRAGIGFAVCVSTIGLGVLLGWSATAEVRLLLQSESGESLFNYLALGDSIAMLGLLLMGLARRQTVKLLIMVVAAIGLFFAYSRTSFFLFLFCSMFVLLVGGRHSHRIGIAAILAILVSLAVTLAGESDTLQPMIERMTVLLFNREADESYEARKVILSEGVQYLKENWLIGRFLDEWWREGVGGGYIHNWLSFWQVYGLIPFLMSLVVFGGSGRALWKQLPKPTAATGTAIALWMYATLAIITSRAYTWPYLWLAMGIVAAVTHRRTNENRVSAPLA